MKYVIKLATTVRVGSLLFDCIGPFDTIQRAQTYITDVMEKEWAVSPPACEILATVSPEEI